MDNTINTPLDTNIMSYEFWDGKGVGFQITDAAGHLPTEVQNKYHAGYMYILEQLFQHVKQEYKVPIIDLRQNVFHDCETGHLNVHVSWQSGVNKITELRGLGSDESRDSKA